MMEHADHRDDVGVEAYFTDEQGVRYRIYDYLVMQSNYRLFRSPGTGGASYRVFVESGKRPEHRSVYEYTFLFEDRDAQALIPHQLRRQLNAAKLHARPTIQAKHETPLEPKP